MSIDNGTAGISHSIHVGYGGPEDGSEFEKIEEFENVVDAMNLPNGDVKFSYEDGSKQLAGARIIRSRVKGLDDAVRYRCVDCKAPDSDLVGRDRGSDVRATCPVCGTEKQFYKMDVNEL